MGALFPYRAPSVNRIVVAWLAAAFGPGTAGLRRPPGGVLPYRMVTVVHAVDTNDRVQRRSVVSVHTFDETMDTAEESAEITHQRMMALGPPLAAPQTVMVNNRPCQIQSLDVIQSPLWVDYEIDETIFRFVSRYQIFASIQPASTALPSPGGGSAPEEL